MAFGFVSSVQLCLFLVTCRPRSITLLRASSVCIIKNQEGIYSKELLKLAEKLSLPFLQRDELAETSFGHALTITPYPIGGATGRYEEYAVGIQSLESMVRSKRKLTNQQQQPAMKPIVIDFCPPPSSNLGRRSAGETGKDLLIKAVSPRRARVLDLTAGFGQDSLLIASSGARSVTMVERDPIIGLLLEDALRRLQLVASKCPERRRSAQALYEKLSLTLGDGSSVARMLLETGDVLPDIVYLDPMFPTRTKKAAVKKNMQVLHGLFNKQDDEIYRLRDEGHLFTAAYEVAQCKVVVKRPINSLHIGSTLPEQPKLSYSIRGAVNRWDVYVK
jgi:16S rRNA (guanine1516-N2)-methyltransferase